jgi:GTP-binding protein
MFVDHAVIFVRSGKGGDGAVSFRREKYIPKGGPDGGDGGRGGDVMLKVDPSMSTLNLFTRQQHFRAKAGEQGRGSSMSGKSAEDVTVPVPPGTLVYDNETDELIADLSDENASVVVVPGGEGGLGNERFKTATHQTPRESTPGGPAIDRVLRLELKLLADVGLIGLPNAGKSTLLRAVSRAKPKVADYPFTTLSPALGIAEMSDLRRLVIADLPGLIAGAAQGAGLGHDFLRHVERTRLLLHVVDLEPSDGSDPAENYAVVREEIAQYSEALADRPEVVALNKVDLIDPDERDERIRSFTESAALRGSTAIVSISGATGAGVPELLEACWRLLGKPDRPAWATQAEES